MDIEKILKGRSNRESREARPFKNFYESAHQCFQAGWAVVEGRERSYHVAIIARSVVITSVTAIEVYFRDILDFLFKYCDPEFFEPHLKKLHQNKYDITDLIEVYRHNVHPLEVVVNDMSFQSVEKIEKTFSLFLKGGLWGQVLSLQVRTKDQPETEASFDAANLEQLRRIFMLRHELVHNPGQGNFLNEDVLNDLQGAISMVFGADVVLSRMLEQNKDPRLSGASGT